MNRIILKHLCQDIDTTLLLSRLTSIPDNIIQDYVINEEEGTSLLELVYYDDGDVKLSLPFKRHYLSSHKSYSSIKKMLNRDWESITLDDINTLRALDINAYTMLKGKQANIVGYVNEFISEYNTITMYQATTNHTDENIIVGFSNNGFVVIYRGYEDDTSESYQTSKNGSKMN